MIFFYRTFIAPILFLLALFLSLFQVKLRLNLKARQKKHNFPSKTKPLWFHCSSGEFEYAKPVIKAVKKQHPSTPILVTYFSVSYEKTIANFPFVDMCCACPLDFPGPLHFFISHHQPQALLIARTDLWPEMLFQCQQKNIPTLVYSVRCTQKFKWYKKFFYSWVLSWPHQIHCVSEKDKTLLESNIPKIKKKILPYGDTRYDQVFERLQNPSPLKQTLFSSSSPFVFLCGSTWIEDEKELLHLTPLIKQNKLRLIIAPHEPTSSRLKKLKKLFEDHKLKTICYSQAHTWPVDCVLVIDKLGLLAELYTKADMAFVGGSFKKSVHNVIEPLAAGVPCFVGPQHKNSREALEFQKSFVPLKNTKNLKIPAVTSIQTGQELGEVLIEIQKKIKNFSTVKNELSSLLKEKTGASQKVLEWIQSL